MKGACSSVLYVRNLQRSLLQKALAPWPRRAAPLLVINCGSGVFLPLLWYSGFDVIAVEPNPELRLNAQNKDKFKIPFYAATENDLPFEENTFDWVVFHVRKKENMEQGIKESLRVAKRGIMITFWNQLSLSYIRASLFHNARKLDFLFTETADFISSRYIWKILKILKAGRLSVYSTLLGLPNSWTARSHFAFMNRLFSKSIFGAWIIIRVDIGKRIPFTPIPVNWHKKLATPATALEYNYKKSD